MPHPRKYITLALLTSLILVVTQLPLWSLPALGSREIRGVWITNVDSEVLFSRSGLETAVNRLAEANFNTIYPVVWSWGYTQFPSAVATRVIGHQQGLYPDLEAQGRNEALEAAQGDRDMLLELVTFAHQRHLSVIPWFEFSFMAPANAELALRHPDWLTQRQGDPTTAPYYQEGRHTRVWLNPFHPQVQQFLLDLIAELMANYDVDGLQLDDHFGLPVEFGYDPVTVNLYRREHRGQAPPSSPRDPEWMRWRAHKLTAFLDRVFRVVKTYKPKAVLSVSPNPAAFAYSHYLQDWPRWEQLGYVEELVVQIYRDSVESFTSALQDSALQRARSHIPTGIGILTGLKDSPVAIARIQAQVQAARDRGFAGVAFFFYDTLWSAAGESSEARQSGVRSLFPHPATRPTVPGNQ